MNWLQRILRPVAIWLAAVSAVDVGRANDGLTRELFTSGTPVDKPWAELYGEIADSLDAWRHNPMARRIVNLITAYVVGPGISLASEYKPLQRFITLFWDHPSNNLDMRIDDWCDELSRSGELYIVLFPDAAGFSHVRAIPASAIEHIAYNPEDYEDEWRYRESAPALAEEKWWYSPGGAPEGWAGAVMLHYAVNKPVGAVRGESDLATILPWLKRYNRWLEDRVRLNAAVRAFLWIVHAPARLLTDLRERYRTPPEAGSLIVADENEQWSAVAPNLHASDAKDDGRAIRWMIAAGGPGTALTDFGEGEDSNLATARATGEQRRRFLLRRQAYFGYVLAHLTITAYNIWSRNTRNQTKTVGDLKIALPDISPENNHELAAAVSELTSGLLGLRSLLGDTPALRRVALRLFVKFSGESLDEGDRAELLTGVPAGTVEEKGNA